MPKGQYDRDASKRRREGLAAELSEHPEEFETDAEFKDADETSMPAPVGLEPSRHLAQDEPEPEPAPEPEPVPEPLPTIPGISPELMAFMMANQQQTQQLIAALAGTKAPALVIEREKKREIDQADYNERGPFQYPEGAKAKAKPKLARPTYFLGMRQREEELTPQEIILFNRFSRGIVQARQNRWSATVTQDGTSERLVITSVDATKLDGRQDIPALPLMLTELLDGQQAADPSRLVQQVTDLMQQIAEMKAQLSGKSVAA